MTEELIGDKVAKLAKDKGFDEDYYKLYDNPRAVNQALLQKWLREEHGKLVFITPKLLISKTVWLNNLNVAKKGVEYASYFKTYEEALEDGLQRALKLIEV